MTRADEERRAVEVAALFEDAVVEVAHLDDPRAGVTRATRALIASGAAAAVVTLIGFFAAYAGASGAFVSALVPLAMLYAVYAIAHGLFRLGDERKPRDFTIGPAAGARFPSPGDGLPGAIFPLVRSTGDDYDLCFTPAMRGDVELDGQRRTLAELIAQKLAPPAIDVAGAHTFPIGARARFVVEHGQVTFVIAKVAAPKKQPMPWKIDWRRQAYTAAVAAVVTLFLGLAYSAPAEPRSLAIDDVLNNPRIAMWMNKPPQLETELPAWLTKREPGENASSGKAAAGETGKMGPKNAPARDRAWRLKGDAPTPQLAKKMAHDAASNSPLLLALRGVEQSQIGMVWRGDHAIGSDAITALGNLSTGEGGEAQGNDGMDLVGNGPGGGGTSDSTVGVDLRGITSGQVGHGPPGGHGPGLGIPFRRKHDARIEAYSTEVKVGGTLDKAIIRRVVHSHMQEIKFCYERELEHHADLNGKVTAQFTIAANGKVLVSVVRDTTLGSPPVERCVQEAVRRWEFPRPDGTGIVMVAYPFVFHPAGNDRPAQ